MPNTRSNFVKAMVDDAYEWALEKYDEEPTIFDQIFQAEDTGNAYEQYTSAIGPGELTETEEGEAITRRTAIEGFTVYCANKKFADELPITNEAIDDNTKVDNFLKVWAQGLGEAARITKEKRHANIFNYGGYTAGHDVFLNDVNNVLTTSYGKLCYDSKPFLNLTGNNRTAKHGGTYYNGVATLDLTETNLQALYKLLTVTNAYNEAGIKISIVPNVILVQMGSDNWFKARRIIESPASTEGIHAGITNLWKAQLKVVGWAFLNDADAYFIGVAKKGLISLARMPLSIDYYEDKNTDSQIVRARVRFGNAVRNFRPWAGANFSTS